MGISDVCLLAKSPKTAKQQISIAYNIIRAIYNISIKYFESTIAQF